MRLVNVETGVSEKSFKLGASHTGGNRDASLENTLSNLTLQVRSKLKELYMITSEVMEVDGKTISILSGEKLGLEKGDFFEIASKDKQKTYKGRTITLPGKTTAGSPTNPGLVLNSARFPVPGPKQVHQNIEIDGIARGMRIEVEDSEA